VIQRRHGLNGCSLPQHERQRFNPIGERNERGGQAVSTRGATHFTLAAMEKKAIRRAALVTLRRAILERFPHTPRKTSPTLVEVF
jgi:hypothetical protein